MPSALVELTTEDLKALDLALTTKLASIGNLRWHRDLTAAEKRVDFVKLADRFDTAEAQIAAAVAPVLKKQQDRLLEQARSVMKSARKNKGASLAADTASLNAGFLGAYQSAIAGKIEPLYREGQRSVRKEMGAAKKAASDPQGLPDRLKQLAEKMARDAAGRMTQRIIDRLFNSLLDFVGGDMWDSLDEDALASQLTGDLEGFAPKVAKEQAGIVTGQAINAGRKDAATEFELGTAMWSAILDNVTCPLCKYLDGMYISTDDPDYEIYNPGSLHPHDRCIWVLIGKDDPDSGKVTWEAPPLDLVLAHAPYLEWTSADFAEAA